MRNLTNISEINNLDAIKGGCGGGNRGGGRRKSWGGNRGGGCGWVPPSCGGTVTPEPTPAPTPEPTPERNPAEMGGGKPE